MNSQDVPAPHEPLPSAAAKGKSSVKANTNKPTQAVINQFVSLPQELQTMIFKDPDLSVEDIVALARATGKPYDVVLHNYIRDPFLQHLFLIANAPYMNEHEILDGISMLSPEYRSSTLISLEPFIRSREGIEAGKKIRVKSRAVIRAMVSDGRLKDEELVLYALTRLNPKINSQERILRAWRSVEDPRSIIDKLPPELEESARWMMKFRQAQAGVRKLQELDHAGQIEVLDKVLWCKRYESSDFDGYADGLLDSLGAQCEQSLHDLVQTPQSPLQQKKSREIGKGN